VVAAWVFGIWGKMQWYPLRWSDAYFATDVWSPALGLNPVLNLADTLKNKSRGYDEAATREYYAEVASHLGVDHPDPGVLSFRREVPGRPGNGRRPNVIVILLEEAANYKTGVSGNPLQPTPNLDALAREGILFRRFYTPAFGTARSVFALVTGIPDVETHETASRNPLIVNQHTIINAFEGYEKLYFLGGSLNWGNVRGSSHQHPGSARVRRAAAGTARRWWILTFCSRKPGSCARSDGRSVVQTSGPTAVHDSKTAEVSCRRMSPEQVQAAGFVGLTIQLDALHDHAWGVPLNARQESYSPDTSSCCFGTTVRSAAWPTSRRGPLRTHPLPRARRYRRPPGRGHAARDRHPSERGGRAADRRRARRRSLCQHDARP
jgi:hypothetical protein